MPPCGLRPLGPVVRTPERRLSTFAARRGPQGLASRRPKAERSYTVLTGTTGIPVQTKVTTVAERGQAGSWF